MVIISGPQDQNPWGAGGGIQVSVNTAVRSVLELYVVKLTIAIL